MGTRCRAVEQYLKKEAPHKHLIFILNKCDLVPTWVAVIPLIPPTSFPFQEQSSSQMFSQGPFVFSIKVVLLRLWNINTVSPRRILVLRVSPLDTRSFSRVESWLLRLDVNSTSPLLVLKDTYLSLFIFVLNSISRVELTGRPNG